MSADKSLLVDCDFHVLKEDWSRYTLVDGTILLVRLGITAILRSEEPVSGDFYNWTIGGTNLISALVPNKLRKKHPTPEEMNWKLEDPSETIKIVDSDENWQEYRTTDGWKIRVKPTVTQALRYKKYNEVGEPVYYAILQSISKAERID